MTAVVTLTRAVCGRTRTDTSVHVGRGAKLPLPEVVA
jgi:hypothetical protein